MDTVSKFYDSLSADYDSLIDFNGRFEHEQSVMREYVQRYNIRSAVDAGCGTGFHSLLLASLGVEVTAVDSSGEMLRKLQEHATNRQVNIQTAQSNLEDLQNVLSSRYDALFCLGNTLAHLSSEEALRQTLSNFRNVVKQEGAVVIQVLNYDRLLRLRERIQNVKERGNKTFIRFYDYTGEMIGFNILTLERSGEKIVHNLRTTIVRPVLREALLHSLHEAGFDTVTVYGSLTFQPFDELLSNDLVVCAV